MVYAMNVGCFGILGGWVVGEGDGMVGRVRGGTVCDGV